MKSILIVIYAHYVKLIIEGKKTVEVRKNKNLANAIKKLIAEQGGCWIYIYVAKKFSQRLVVKKGEEYPFTDEIVDKTRIVKLPTFWEYENCGKVVARFWCDKVEEIKFIGYNCYATQSLTDSELLRYSCLSFEQLDNYLNVGEGYAIHISKLEVFDRPRELSEFNRKIVVQYQKPWGELCSYLEPLTKAPQNYCFVEGEE